MLPFILGAAVGAGAVVAVQRRKTLREEIVKGVSVAKESITKGLQKAKSVLSKGAEDAKESVEDFGSDVKKKIHTITEKKENTKIKEAK